MKNNGRTLEDFSTLQYTAAVRTRGTTSSLLLVYATQVNGAFRTSWLVNSKVISKVLFFSEQPKRKEIASCFTMKVMFWPASYSACVVYTKTIESTRGRIFQKQVTHWHPFKSTPVCGVKSRKKKSVLPCGKSRNQSLRAKNMLVLTFSFYCFQMSGHTTKQLYVPLLLWLVVLATLYDSATPVSAARRQGTPSVMDPCPPKCKSSTLFPCLKKCELEDKPFTDKQIECQQDCTEEFHKCIDECHAKIKKENKEIETKGKPKTSIGAG